MTAKIITFVQQKGGTGKSLAAIHLAFALEKLGYRTGIIDLGALAATSEWFDHAKQHGLQSSVLCCASADWRLQKDIQQMESQGVSFILVDTASIQANDTQTQAVLSLADFSIIPFQSGILDEWAVDKTIQLINQHRIPYRMLRNRCSSTAKPYTAARLLPFVLNGFLSDDATYVNALQSFTTVYELTDSLAAAQELEGLAKEICDLVQPKSVNKTAESAEPLLEKRPQLALS